MRKTRVAKKIWYGTKVGIGMGVGLATDVAFGTAMLKCVPSGISPAMKKAYYAGTGGTTLVMGSLATELTINQINSTEKQFKRRWRHAKRQARGYHKHDNRKANYNKTEERTTDENVKIIEENVKKIKESKEKSKK